MWRQIVVEEQEECRVIHSLNIMIVAAEIGVGFCLGGSKWGRQPVALIKDLI